MGATSAFLWRKNALPKEKWKLTQPDSPARQAFHAAHCGVGVRTRKATSLRRIFVLRQARAMSLQQGATMRMTDKVQQIMFAFGVLAREAGLTTPEVFLMSKGYKVIFFALIV